MICPSCGSERVFLQLRDPASLRNAAPRDYGSWLVCERCRREWPEETVETLEAEEDLEAETADARVDVRVEEALLRALRRPRHEPQLTQALAALCCVDRVFAARFLELVLKDLGKDARVPEAIEVVAEEPVPGSRFDLRFRAPGWDVIVELKIDADYGPEWLNRYLGWLRNEEHSYVVAITRNVPYGEEEPDPARRWLGATRWRQLLPGLRSLPVQNDLLRQQWQLFLNVLEEEGSLGFIQPQPELFDVFARARVATDHVAEFLRSIEQPLVGALRMAVGEGEAGADLLWPRGGTFARDRWGRIAIPFRVRGSTDPRVYAGVYGWEPPTSFFVQPAPNRRWDRGVRSEVRHAVETLVAASFDQKWMRAYRSLDGKDVPWATLEQDIVQWAHDRFAEIEHSGLFALPLESLATPTSDGRHDSA